MGLTRCGRPDRVRLPADVVGAPPAPPDGARPPRPVRRRHGLRGARRRRLRRLPAADRRGADVRRRRHRRHRRPRRRWRRRSVAGRTAPPRPLLSFHSIKKTRFVMKSPFSFFNTISIPEQHFYRCITNGLFILPALITEVALKIQWIRVDEISRRKKVSYNSIVHHLDDNW